MFAFAAALNFLSAAYFLNKEPVSPADIQFVVDRIIDGDTLVLATGQRIRLQNIDAPEETFCGYDQAKQQLESLLPAGVSLHLTGDYVDRDGRRIALVYLGDILINEKMLLSGWAKFTSATSSENDRLKAAGEFARHQKLGVYSSLCRQSTNPNNPDCSIKGNHGERENIYSFPGCGSYPNTILELDEGDVWFCTEDQAAAAGFTKAKNCLDKVFSP